ncbi:recombination protein O N-terminal domain-containing protein, partial [Bittarella massiliensis (ex Durand et al. 2017)]
MAYTQMCGIVIREVQVGEADKIVHLLTDRAGIVSASAK